MAETVNEELLDSLEKRVEDLRNWYEQYFMGTRKRAPEQEKTSVQYLIRRLSNQPVNNTRLRFRFQQVVAKFNSYNQYWNRTMQKIESGTYFRSRFKAQLHAGPVDQAPSPRGQRSSTGPGKSEDDVSRVYDDFIKARKECNQATNISKDKLAETMKKQASSLEQKYKGKQVKFKVVVEGGQAKLKATLK